MRIALISLITVVLPLAAAAQTPPGPKPNTSLPPGGTVDPGKPVNLGKPAVAPAPSSEPLAIGSGDPRRQSPPKYGTYGPQGESRAVCGGLKDGKVIVPCADKPARFIDDAVYACPRGSVVDVASDACWSCPQGFRRSVRSADGEKACRKQDEAESGGYAAAQFVASACPAGSFRVRQREGECWSCPAGFHRGVAPIRSKLACVRPTPEQTAPAVRTRDVTPEGGGCEPGEFLDSSTGACFACPAGFVRLQEDLTSPMACGRGDPKEHAAATLVAQRTCGEGEFLASRNGGECWRCPKLHDRTVFPAIGPKACIKADNVAYSEARFVTSLTCAPEEVYDPASSRDPKVVDAIRAQWGSVPPGLGGRGTCWSCPPGYKRTIFPVYGKDACESIGVDWSPAPYRQPGLFGLDGGEAVAREVITRRPEIIAEFAKALGPTAQVPADQAVREAWEEIRDEPQNSLVLKLAVFTRIQAAAAKPASATEAERKLVASFALAIQRYREFLADNALGAARAWHDADFATRNQQSQSTAAQTGGLTGGNVTELFKTEPPDFEAISAAIIGETFAGTAAVLTAALAIAGANNINVNTAVFPFGDDASKIAENWTRHSLFRRKYGNKVGLIVTEDWRAEFRYAGKVTGRKAFIEFGTKIGDKIAMNIFNVGSAGLSFAIEIAVEVIVNTIIMVVDRANLIPKLEANLAEAKQPVDLARLAATSKGFRSEVGYWNNSMAANMKSSDPAAFTTTAGQQIQKLQTPAK